jgi:pilus assembly protein CpaC
VSVNRLYAGTLAAAVLLGAAALQSVRADENGSAAVQNEPAPQNEASANAPGKLTLTVGKSLIIDSPVNIRRVAVANDDLVQAVAVDPKQVLINGKGPGETSLIVWQENGSRLLYDLTIRMSPLRLDAVRQQLAREFPGENVNVTYENETAFVRGTVKDIIAADRVMSIAGTLGKTVNLLRVEVPPVETQVLLKVRFANVDRSVSTDLGLNIASGAFNQDTSITTGQFPPIKIDGSGNFSLSDALNVFLFRKDLNLGATIKALQSKNLLQMLAEPNVMAINGKQASFVAGGEFPFPMLQGGAGVGAVTIMFREFGVRLNFLPAVTPRGTIRLQVAPEVSSLDYAHAVTFQGFTIPALATRRVVTEVELETGQSFVIAGLLDNETTENLNKIPGLANIPLFGKLFQTKSISRNNSELLVIVTPEIVRPIPAGQPAPSLNYPTPFMPSNTKAEMRQPGLSQTGPVPVQAPADSIPVEELAQQQKQGQAAPNPSMPQFQLIPVPVPQASPSANPGLTPSPIASAPNSGGVGK